MKKSKNDVIWPSCYCLGEQREPATCTGLQGSWSVQVPQDYRGVVLGVGCPSVPTGGKAGLLRNKATRATAQNSWICVFFYRKPYQKFSDSGGSSKMM